VVVNAIWATRLPSNGWAGVGRISAIRSQTVNGERLARGASRIRTRGAEKTSMPSKNGHHWRWFSAHLNFSKSADMIFGLLSGMIFDCRG
jgi:hypothetical protein